MRARRLIALLAISALAFSACSKGSKTFNSAQIRDFMLTQADLPAQLQVVQSASGPLTLDQAVSSDEEKTKMASLHFQGAFEAAFANQSLLAAKDQTNFPNDAEFVGSIAIVFKTADDAHQALTFESGRDVRTGTNVQTVSVDKLGDETVAITGQTDTLFLPGDQISWRVGNALFIVAVCGNNAALDVSMSNAAAWAKIVDDRAKKA
jgi:hypothetical protein